MKDKLGDRFSKFLRSLGLEVIDCSPQKVKCEFKDVTTGKRLSNDCPVCKLKTLQKLYKRGGK